MPYGPPWWHHTFRGYGYRITAPREAILDLLGITQRHMSAEEIYFTLHKKYPGIGLTTVYRTLSLLEQMGLVHKFEFGDGRARYELAQGPKVKHHHHLVCIRCGRVINYDEFVDEELKLMKSVQDALEKKYSFKIKTHQLCFYGLCSKCQSETNTR